MVINLERNISGDINTEMPMARHIFARTLPMVHPIIRSFSQGALALISARIGNVAINGATSKSFTQRGVRIRLAIASMPRWISLPPRRSR
ncbi:MAG: hypothetical protein LBI37_00800 [Puniceicoccales bacterium]|jgi:hypothetical protein|nr:hypothetical protein [Puniceicoccales bacterium]